MIMQLFCFIRQWLLSARRCSKHALVCVPLWTAVCAPAASDTSVDVQGTSSDVLRFERPLRPDATLNALDRSRVVVPVDETPQTEPLSVRFETPVMPIDRGLRSSVPIRILPTPVANPDLVAFRFLADGPILGQLDQFQTLNIAWINALLQDTDAGAALAGNNEGINTTPQEDTPPTAEPVKGDLKCQVTKGVIRFKQGEAVHDPLKFPTLLPLKRKAGKDLLGPVVGTINRPVPKELKDTIEVVKPFYYAGWAYEYHFDLNGLHGCYSQPYVQGVYIQVDKPSKSATWVKRKGSFRSLLDDQWFRDGPGVHTRSKKLVKGKSVFAEGTEKRLHGIDAPGLEGTAVYKIKTPGGVKLKGEAPAGSVEVKLDKLRHVAWNAGGKGGLSCQSWTLTVLDSSNRKPLAAKEVKPLLEGLKDSDVLIKGMEQAYPGNKKVKERADQQRKDLPNAVKVLKKTFSDVFKGAVASNPIFVTEPCKAFK